MRLADSAGATDSAELEPRPCIDNLDTRNHGGTAPWEDSIKQAPSPAASSGHGGNAWTMCSNKFLLFQQLRLFTLATGSPSQFLSFARRYLGRYLGIVPIEGGTDERRPPRDEPFGATFGPISGDTVAFSALTTSFSIGGLHLFRSSAGNLYLRKADLKTEGHYTCEVSADVPFFETVRTEKELKVHVLPKKGPSIHGTKPHYRIGDVVNVTCYASATKPPASLKWYINGEQVSNRYLVHYPIRRLESGRQEMSLGLRFTVRPAHCVGDEMRIKCMATLQYDGKGPPSVTSSSASPRDSTYSEKEFMLGSSSHHSSGTACLRPL
ncbi:hypothetical protein HPB50_024406 [Hyalomma asiaticum]|uniref:Uncharacterized protein n=1 Tax=Hyalomma asiaticum TaxID=266040 RepID=A0ACB7S9A0_HYAAI|nr:hypothetical protein HPB50_024406 [Hyalomma asiaticum]